MAKEEENKIVAKVNNSFVVIVVEGNNLIGNHNRVLTGESAMNVL